MAHHMASLGSFPIVVVHSDGRVGGEHVHHILQRRVFMRTDSVFPQYLNRPFQARMAEPITHPPAIAKVEVQFVLQSQGRCTLEDAD